MTLLHLDSQPSGYKSMPDWPRDPISDDIPQRQEKPPDSKTVPYRNKDNAVRMAPSELAKDPMSGSQSEPLVWNPVSDAITENRKSEERSLSERSWQTRQSSAGTEQLEYTESRPDSEEAIVVGAIGSAVPWFLTGWAHDVEIEFMIDTGCQVIIFFGDGVPAHVRCETGGAFRVASLPAPAGISGLISPDGAGPVGIGHRVPGTVL